MTVDNLLTLISACVVFCIIGSLLVAAIFSPPTK